jgi:molybdenum cofactor biosynthesis protein B
MSETVEKHKAEAPKKLKFAVVTISTSRFKLAKQGEKIRDEGGEIIVKLLTEAGHSVAYKELIPDDPKKIIGLLEKLLRMPQVEAVITTGGTGVARRDVAVEAVRSILEKELPGFGELLRMLSFQDIGSAAMMTRAIAGVARGKAIFCLPGSPRAVELAVKELILPEAGHVVKHAREG